MTPDLTVEDGAHLAELRSLCRSKAARSIRIAAGLSLSEVASITGVSSASTILRWERGERVPRGTQALRYAALLQRLIGGES